MLKRGSTARCRKRECLSSRSGLTDGAVGFAGCVGIKREWIRAQQSSRQSELSWNLQSVNVELVRMTFVVQTSLVDGPDVDPVEIYRLTCRTRCSSRRLCLGRVCSARGKRRHQRIFNELSTGTSWHVRCRLFFDELQMT